MFQVAAQGCLVIFLQLWLYGSTQDCLRPANTDDDSLPSFEDLENAEQLPNGNGAQAIVTNYQFHCCGIITAWLTQVEPNGEDLTYSINFQVWRPSPTVGSDGAGEYSLVGENRFVSITSVPPISVTPEPTKVISVRPGDVVGLIQSHPRDESTDGIQFVTSSYSYDRLLWYQTSFSLGSSSTVMVGTGGALPSSTNAEMQLSVEISTYPCTPLPTPQTTPPTTAPLTTTPPTTEAIPHVDPTTTDIDTPTTDAPLVNQPTTPESATDQTPEPPTTPQGATGPISQTIPPSLSDDNSVNIGLIVSLVVVVVLLLMASAIIATMAIRRYQKTESKKFNNQISRWNEKGTRQTLRQATLMKPMSSSNNSPDILSDGVTNAGYSTNCFQDSCTEESQHYYSAVGASTGAFTDSENADVIYTELKDATDSKQTDALVTENITVTSNECYSINIHMKVNECYGTVTDDIPLEANESYTTTQMRANECNGVVANDIPLEVNEKKCNSVTADDIPLEVNESYITNTSIRANEFQNATANNVRLEANESYEAIDKEVRRRRRV